MDLSKTLYIGNLPWATTEQNLVDLVSPLGKVHRARIITDRETGRSRGYGFVEVSPDDASAIVQALNEAEFGGRVLTVSEAQARQR